MTSQRFVNYPEPHETTHPDVEHPEDNNPAMRGLPLVIGATLISKLAFLQKFLWNNAKFWMIAEMPAVKARHPRYHPHVIPLGNGEPAPNLLDFEEHLRTPKPLDIIGRYHTIADYHAAYKAKEVTPLQVVEALLQLILRGQNPRSKFDNAWVDFYGGEQLAIAAAKASTERWAAGKELGLLDGVPFGVKDETKVKGYVTHYGMKYDPSKDFFKPEEETSYPVRMFEEQGAVVLGKLAMHELGNDTSGCNPTWGTPTNWLNTSYYPGGSSSGHGSALLAGIIPFAIGSDAGGSARIPPCFTGMYGLKPSHHRVDVQEHSMCVTGPIASTVADLTIAYRIMSQPNPDDHIQCRFHPSIPPHPSAKKTIGIYRPWFNKCQPSVLDHCNKAVEHYENLGYEVIDVTIPHLREAQLAHGIICITEMAAKHFTRANTPSEAMGMLNSQSKVLISIGSQTPAVDYLRFNQLRELMMQHMAFLFKKHPGLLILTPTSPVHGWKIHPGDQAHGFTDANFALDNMRFVFLANMTGCPAITVPVGYVDPEQGEGKVPIGLMAMGEWGAEEQLLSWAGEAEKYLHEEYPGGRRRPDAWVDVFSLAKSKKEAKNSKDSDE